MQYKPLLNPNLRNSIPHLLFALLFALGASQAHAGKIGGAGNHASPRACLLCNISGPTSTTVGSAEIFNLTGGCTTAGWSVSNGATIQHSTSTSVTVIFNNTGTTNIETAGGSGGSASINVTVTLPPLSGGAINNPSQTIDFGNTPALITATNASGGTCGTSYTYQWYSSTDGSNYFPISGATGVNYQPVALTVTTFFKRLASCSGATAFSNVATVTVNPQLQPATITNPSQTIDFGTTPGQITAGTSSGGSCGTSYGYQWQVSTDGTNFSNISGAAGQNYQPGALTVTTWYRRVTSCNGVTVMTTNAIVNVNPQLQAGIIANPSQTIDYGGTPGQINAAVSSGGGCGTGYAYLWYSSTDGSNFSSTGFTTQNYQPGPLTTTTYYKRVTTCNGVTVSTTVATVTVNGRLNPGTITPASQAINSGATVATLNLSGVSGSTAPYTYQWQSSPDASFSSITNVGTGGTGFTPSDLTSTTYYQVLVTSATGVQGFSSSAVVSVYPSLQVGNIIPATQTINFDATPSSLSLTGLTGGNGVYSYQWQSSSDQAFANPVNVSTTPTIYSPPNPGVTTYYRLMVTSNGISAYSNTVVINVISALSGGTISGNTGPINYNSLPGSFSSTQDASGSTCAGNYIYQWQYSFDGTTWHDLINAQGNTYSSPIGLTISEYFRRQVSCNGANAYSNIIHVQVKPQKQNSCTQ